MFTQIGIGGLVIAYTIVGAFIFQQIELIGPKHPKDVLGLFLRRLNRFLWQFEPTIEMQKMAVLCRFWPLTS